MLICAQGFSHLTYPMRNFQASYRQSSGLLIEKEHCAVVTLQIASCSRTNPPLHREGHTEPAMSKVLTQVANKMQGLRCHGLIAMRPGVQLISACMWSWLPALTLSLLLVFLRR